MTDADNTNTSQNQNTNTGATGTGNTDALNQQLAQVQEQLGKMNQQLEAQAQAFINAQQQRQQALPKEEENLFEPQQLLRKVEQIFDTKNREVKNKDFVIYELSQEYPEVSSDPKLRAAVLEAQKRQPALMQDTPEGYRLAVLEATSKAGLVAKSQRKTVEDEPSYDGRRRTEKPKARVKVSAATLEAAALMGRNIEDPEVLKRLEDAANRDTYGKYR